MAPSSKAEKQRRYRERLNADPTRREQYLAKKRQKYVRDKENGNVKLINDLSERAKRRRQKLWRKDKRASRARKQTCLTPPESPAEAEDGPSRQLVQARERSRRKHKKTEAKIRILEEKINRKEIQLNKYKMRFSRLNAKKDPNSPGTKAKKLLFSSSPKKTSVKRTLRFHFALLNDMRKKYAGTKSERKKAIYRQLLAGKLVRKYRFLESVNNAVGCKVGKKNVEKVGRKTRASTDQRNTLKEFFTRDDISRVATGKKNCITLKKVKKQKRLLLDSMKNAHMKFQAEYVPGVSYSLFCRLRPFWVVAPSEGDRDTCMCRSHQNFQFMTDALFRAKCIEQNNIDNIAKEIMCDPQSYNCAYGLCTECKSNAFPMTKQTTNNDISYQQWVTEEKTYPNSDKVSKVTVKSTKVETEMELEQAFQESLTKYKKHSFNITKQYQAYKAIRENLDDESCLIHIDFSENYSCGYATEIQAVHFGGSHSQATMHTGVLYLRDKPPLCFCTISDSTRHDPPAIWAHLEPILNLVKNEYPTIKYLHFFSDGPATQYKQKANFYLLSNIPFQKGFAQVSWNFFESSHGKGAPDGVGGSLKRQADALKRHGTDIPDAKALFRVFNDETSTTIKLYFVEKKAEDEYVKILDLVNGLQNIKGTMQLHQVISLAPNDLKVRNISCVCQMTNKKLDCGCFGLKSASVLGLRSEPAQDKAPTEGSDHTSQLSRPAALSDEMIGKWSIVEYDGKPYPGKIVDYAEDEVLVECLHKVGQNRFTNPRIKDILWYTDDKVIALIPEPIYANRRHMEINESIWNELNLRYDLV